MTGAKTPDKAIIWRLTGLRTDVGKEMRRKRRDPSPECESGGSQSLHNTVARLTARGAGSNSLSMRRERGAEWVAKGEMAKDMQARGVPRTYARF
jgi:hypothetical protein